MILLDDDKDLCTVLSEIIVDLGSPHCVTVNSLEELKKLESKIFDYDIALLDVNLGDDKPTGIDAYNWMLEKGFKGKFAFFTGHARSNPLVKVAIEIPNVTLLEKPANLAEISELIS